DLGVLVGGRCDLAEPEVVGRGREVAEAVGDLLHVDVDSGVVIVGQAVALAVEVGWAGDGGELALAVIGHVGDGGRPRGEEAAGFWGGVGGGGGGRPRAGPLGGGPVRVRGAGGGGRG